MSRPRNSTKVEQLMDLSDIFDQPPSRNNKMQSVEGYPPPPNMNSNYDEQMYKEIEEREKSQNAYQGKIRNFSQADYRNAMNAGATDYSEFNPMSSSIIKYQSPIKSQLQSQPSSFSREYDEEDMEFEMGPRSLRKNEMPYLKSPSISCIEIARHIKSCPICSKFYDNDKTGYVIAIVFLLVACIILLKKVIESFGNK